MIRAASQPISGIIRVGKDYRGYPDPWEYQVTYSSNDGRLAFLHAMKGDGGFTPDHKTAIGHEIWRLGFRSAEWERIEAVPEGKKSRPVAVSEGRLRAYYHAQIRKMAEGV